MERLPEVCLFRLRYGIGLGNVIDLLNGKFGAGGTVCPPISSIGDQNRDGLLPGLHRYPIRLPVRKGAVTGRCGILHRHKDGIVDTELRESSLHLQITW